MQCLKSYLQLKLYTNDVKITPLGIEGVWLVQSPVFRDERGLFREWFRSEASEELTGKQFRVAQANVSLSSKGTLRGIHFSIAPEGQAKLVTCITGAIQDVIVDIRTNSPTFGQWIDLELASESGDAIFISEGLGHAFLALQDKTALAYLVSTAYSPVHEFGINPFDKKIAIRWHSEQASLTISDRDLTAPTLSELEELGKLPK